MVTNSFITPPGVSLFKVKGHIFITEIYLSFCKFEIYCVFIFLNGLNHLFSNFGIQITTTLLVTFVLNNVKSHIPEYNTHWFYFVSV